MSCLRCLVGEWQHEPRGVGDTGARPSPSLTLTRWRVALDRALGAELLFLPFSFRIPPRGGV